MESHTGPKQGEKPNEKALVETLSRFVENSPLSFYKIASCVGISGTRFSMWLTGRVAPRAEELSAIERFLERQ
jgi:hypothetical protein